MDFSDRISALARRVKDQRDHVKTEEATKTAFVMPFLTALGYDVFDSRVVIPEFTADVGTKQKEKVDYAIQKDGKIIILIECKPCADSDYLKHHTQLYRYFSVTEARFSIMTNGIKYWFYSDLDNPNKMDERPFFEFDLLDYRTNDIDELKKFASDSFEVDSILETANALKYTNAISREIAKEIENPSEDMIKVLASRVYSGRFTQAVKDDFAPIVERAFKEQIRRIINAKLSSAMDSPDENTDQEIGISKKTGSSVETTEDEIEAYNIVKAIVRDIVEPKRVIMRDAKSYCAILIDNNRKPLARLHFNSKTQIHIGLFDEAKNEDRIKIDDLNDIFSHSERIRDTAKLYV